MKLDASAMPKEEKGVNAQGSSDAVLFDDVEEVELVARVGLEEAGWLFLSFARVCECVESSRGTRAQRGRGVHAHVSCMCALNQLKWKKTVQLRTRCDPHTCIFSFYKRVCRAPPANTLCPLRDYTRLQGV